MNNKSSSDEPTEEEDAMVETEKEEVKCSCIIHRIRVLSTYNGFSVFLLKNSELEGQDVPLAVKVRVEGEMYDIITTSADEIFSSLR